MKKGKSLERLEDAYWLEVDFPTSLVEKCHIYRKLPLDELIPEQVCVLLSQQIGVAYLLPKAL